MTISYRYFDTAGNVTVENVQNNSVGQTESYAKTSYMYDKRNRVTTVIDRGTGGKDTPIYTQYEYDNVGNVTRVVTGHTKLIAAGEEVPEGATENRYEYDRFGNVTKAIDGMGNEITTEYNLMGLAKKVTDRNGTVTQSTYNGYGSPLEVKTGGEETKKYTYSVNNLVKKTEYGEESTTYTYDKFGNVASEKTGDIEKKYTYDTNGNVTGTDVYRGTVREIHEIRQYDVLNRLTLVNNMDAITANYEYTANGNVKKETKPNLTTTYTYSLAGLLTRKQTVSKSDGIIKNNNYVYDLRGNIVKKTSNDEGTTNYVYDGHNRLISEETGGKSKKYTYDGRGNRTRLETYDTVINYTYDKNNRLVNEEVDEDGDRYWYRNYTYSYDKNGNRLTKKLNGSKTLETNTYNGYNQLISRTENGKTNTYTYDIGGLRKSKTVNGVTTKQVWSMGELAMEINGGTDTVKAKYYHGITPIGMRTSGGQLYYTTSYNGTVEKVTNLGGGVVADYTYDAFGNQTDSTADEIYNPFRYCGEYYDEESGLIYLRNRYYDPSIGAFINEDPARDGLNWYVYCSGNPVAFVDPWGLAPTPMEAAEMADHIYKDISPQSSIAFRRVSGGWRLIDVWTEEGTSIKIGIYVRGDGKDPASTYTGVMEYAFVNRGTNTWFTDDGLSAEGKNNLQQPVGLSEDMKRSIESAKYFTNGEWGDYEITFIGHSKGGAEAIANAVATNRNCITFNPAKANLEAYGLKKEQKYYSKKMVHYVVEGEILNCIFKENKVGLTVKLPTQVPLSKDSNFPRIANHSMAAVKSALKEAGFE